MTITLLEELKSHLKSARKAIDTDNNMPRKKQPGRKCYEIWYLFHTNGARPNRPLDAANKRARTANQSQTTSAPTTAPRHPTATCKACSTEFRSAQPNLHLAPHVAECTKIEPAVKRTYLAPFFRGCTNHEEPRRKSTATSNADTQDSEEENGSYGKRVRLTTAMADELQTKLARFIYASGSPFQLSEGDEFRDLIMTLLPNFPFPSREQVATVLLDRVYELLKAGVISELKRARHVAVCSDGWTDPNMDSIVNFVLTSAVCKPVFWASKCTESSRHTAEYLCTITKDVVKDITETWDVGAHVVSGMVTDNAKNMLGLQERITETIPSVFANGCAAHVMNLLVQDMFKIPLLNNILKEAVTVSNYVRNRTAMVRMLKQLQQQDEDATHRWKLKLPANTRWYSVGACMSSVVQNEHLIKAITANKKFMSCYKKTKKDRDRLATVQAILNDDLFWANAQLALKLLEPVLDALADLEKDTCCLSMVYELFSDLKANEVYKPVTTGRQTDTAVVAGIRSEIQALIVARWEFVHTGSMGIAYLLDQTKPTNKIIGSRRTQAIKTLLDYAARNGIGSSRDDLEKKVIRFLREKAFSSDDEKVEHAKCDPYFWWSNRIEIYPELSRLAMRVFSISTSSAASERSWSAFKFLHSQSRNRLSTATVEKLVFIYSNIGFKAGFNLYTFR